MIVSKVNTEILNAELNLGFEYIKEENSNWMNLKIQIHVSIRPNCPGNTSVFLLSLTHPSRPHK